MSELGDLLVALHGGPRFRTLRGVVRSWNDTRRSLEAFKRAVAGDSSRVAFYGDPAGVEPPEASETVGRIWLELPDRARTESEHRHGDVPVRTTVVIAGDTWWSVHGDGEITTNGGDPDHVCRLGGPEHLLDGRRWLSSAELTPLGETTLAGRRCLLAAARPRALAPLLGHDLDALPGFGGGQELAVDSEYGVLLRRVASLDGEPYLIEEFTEVSFDEPIDPALFTFEPPPGSDVQVATATPSVELSLHEAARAASFTVFAPPSVPPCWVLGVRYIGATRHGPESVLLHYRAEDASARVTVTEHPAAGHEPEPARTRWRTVGCYRLRESGDDAWPTLRVVTFEREGTSVQLTSAELDLDALLELAETFVPASSEPPRPGHR